MEKLLLATNNQGKIEEYRYLLKGILYELVTPAQVGLKMDVPESGVTYAENACLKAVALAAAGKLLTLADDSGLEVDALNGEPGIHSSRYAGDGASDADRVAFLLAKLKDVPAAQRTARFCCVIAIAGLEGRTALCTGSCEGLITFAPRGQEGFGYDPVFYFPDLKKTMAELPPEVKNRISHRALAAREAVKILNGKFN
jgi:XTP/dITP diphosphohydrolase